MSLVTPTFTASPSTLGTDEMIYSTGTNIFGTTEGGTKYLIYSDTSAWIDFQLQVVDTTTYTEFQPYETLTDGYAIMGLLEYDTDDSGSTAIASSELFGQCISIEDSTNSINYITCSSCTNTSGATVDSSITAADLTCTDSYKGSTIPSDGDAITSVGSATNPGTIYGFEGAWSCTPSVTVSTATSNTIVSVQCHTFQTLVADNANGKYRFDSTTDPSLVSMWSHTSANGLKAYASVDAALWKGAIQSFTLASAALALASFHLF